MRFVDLLTEALKFEMEHKLTLDGFRLTSDHYAQAMQYMSTTNSNIHMFGRTFKTLTVGADKSAAVYTKEFGGS